MMIHVMHHTWGQDWPTKATPWHSMVNQEYMKTGYVQWIRVPGSYTSMPFLYVMNNAYKIEYLLKSYFLVGNECPIRGCFNKDLGLNTRSGWVNSCTTSTKCTMPWVSTTYSHALLLDAKP